MKWMYLTILLSGNILFATAQNVGINTTIPQAALDVRGTGSTSGTWAVVVSNAVNDTSFLVSDNGNVGLGTNFPAYRLDVQTTNPIAGRFSGRVVGLDAVNNNEFVTLGQVGTLSGGSGGGVTVATQFSTPSTTATTFAGALMYCRTLTEGGHTDWRLAYTDEFNSMLQDDAVVLPTFANDRYYWLDDRYPASNATNTSSTTINKPSFYYSSGGYGASNFRNFPNYEGSAVYPICVR